MYQLIIKHHYFGFTFVIQNEIIYPTLEAYEVGMTAEEIGQYLGGN